MNVRTDPLARLRDEAALRVAGGMRRAVTPRSSADDVLDLASNDYLGLTRDARVVHGAVSAVRRWGAGSTGSRLVTGSTVLHAELEDDERVVEVRRIGTMTGIEVRPHGERTGFAVCQAARRRGVWVRPLGDVVILMPPLAIGDDDLELLTSAVLESVDEVVR